jgi:D-tyrosyl-tRNA(Tyr) deacylase
MRTVIQRVNSASVTIGGEICTQTGKGLLILAGFEETDTGKSIEWMCNKIINMRIFADSNGKMNLSVRDTDGEILTVSQFTLYASTRKGNRPSFIRAAPPAVSEPLYQTFVKRLGELLGKPVATGVFGADMKIALVNDGPVTIVIDTERPE